MQVLSCKTDTIFGYKWHWQTKYPFQLGEQPTAPPQGDVHSVQMLTNYLRDKFLAQQTNKLLTHSSIEEQVHYATSTTPARNFQRPPSGPISKSCFFCGSKAPHPREKCPAQGQTCSYCHKLGHFSSVCQQAVRDQRPSRSPPKKPLVPTPSCGKQCSWAKSKLPPIAFSPTSCHLGHYQHAHSKGQTRSP